MNPKQNNHLKRLLPRHHKILDLTLKGYTTTQVADSLNISRSAVSRITGSPLFQDTLSRRREKQDAIADNTTMAVLQEARDHIHRAALDAVNVHTDVIHSGEATTRQKQVSASEILDRAFGKQDEKKAQPAVILQGAAIENLLVALKESDSSE
mgnify:FL=1